MKRRRFLKLIPVLASLPLVSRLIPAHPASPALTDGLVAHWDLTGTGVTVSNPSEPFPSIGAPAIDFRQMGWDAGWRMSTEDLAAIAQEIINRGTA